MSDNKKKVYKVTKSKKKKTDNTKKTAKTDNAKSAVKNGAKSAPVKSKTEKKPPERKQLIEDSSSSLIHQAMPYFIGVLALFVTVCFISTELTGIIGKGLRGILYGLFGAGAVTIPVAMILLTFMWRRKLKEEKLGTFMICEVSALLFLFAMIHIWTGGCLSFSIGSFWENGISLCGGGIVGGIFGVALYKLTGTVGAHIIGISGMLFFSIYMFGITPHYLWVNIKYRIHESMNKKASYDEPIYEKPQQKRGSNDEPSRVKRDPVNRHHFEPDEPLEDEIRENNESFAGNFDLSTVGKQKKNTSDGRVIVKVDSDADVPPFDIDGTLVEAADHGEKTGTSQPNGTRSMDFSGIFSNDEGVDVLQRFADEQKAKAIERNRRLGSMQDGNPGLELSRSSAVNGFDIDEPKKEYVFPPISLLKLDTSPKNVDISDELHQNATKLVETLRSFKVPTRIVNVSRGPTITRYELQPEEGVRVRSITNLVDDISLNLATSGVRIEAPIPGKAAVGVEVPNKSVSTVYLRDLVSTESFRKATSKLNVVLGVDVAGDPVFLDIAKMPHLLIAGATGMGKSVCINSLITSLLYKATPDEVKLILIDPKKVEFNLYNGLPHLLVPVVSDPKKAAGSLQWAVTEMERRFVLIEEAGVRDIKNYNAVTKDDPDREFLPNIIIIIDELADLMMTAPDDVETSICRLAQKARAAGMHLVIGTQRPSVDVITGLIKANIPSRIAFTVSSQTDSRVILDIGGAEKLIGRGDMLFAPVGASKPTRVQGAFVSESEVEGIVDYIKENNGDTNYSDDIIDSIERAAAACGNGKKGSSSVNTDFDDESGMADPMLRPAIELAIESGKISTSLIQRRLSLGYGRAAKLIDEMQIRGFVSPPEGQKPRTVLITKEQYMEMILDRKEDLG